jgi:diguanylate cyclase
MSPVWANVSLGFTAFFLGVAATAFAFRAFARQKPVADETPKTSDNDLARACMAADQLRDLARSVIVGVGEHSSLMDAIATRLGDAKSPADRAEAVASAIEDVLSANEKLRHRLEEAEHKIEQQAEEIRIQHSEARTDSLTKLPNRRAFDAALEAALEKRRADAEPFSLLLLDIDRFKRLNDGYGHLAGDEVLRAIGRMLPNNVKKCDLACRFGGEEFVVLMSGARLPEAQTAAERIRRAIESLLLKHDGQTLRVTASVGIAEGRGADGTLDILRRADECVYASKRAGRNCSHWHDGEKCFLIDLHEDGPRQTGAFRTKFLASGSNFVAHLPGRAAFSSELQRRLAESSRTGQPLAVVQFGVKEYAAMAQKFGQGAIESLADALGGFIASSLREMDLLGRLSVSEYIAMLPGATAQGAKIVARRTAASVSQFVSMAGEVEVRCELDFAVATPEPTDDASTLMAAVRRALAENIGHSREIACATVQSVEAGV